MSIILVKIPIFLPHLLEHLRRSRSLLAARDVVSWHELMHLFSQREKPWQEWSWSQDTGDCWEYVSNVCPWADRCLCSVLCWGMEGWREGGGGMKMLASPSSIGGIIIWPLRNRRMQQRAAYGRFFFFFYQEKLGNFCESKQISIKGWLLNIDTISDTFSRFSLPIFYFFFRPVTRIKWLHSTILQIPDMY